MNELAADLSFWPILKIMFMIGLLVYIVFAVVMVRQVSLMTKTLELGHENFIKYMSIGHLVFAIGIFLLALIIL
jgi:hypothetical protein